MQVAGGNQPPVTPDWPLLGQNASGEDVRTLQYLLNQTQSANLTVDGEFGANTTAAVKVFQRAHSLTADGIAGAATWSALVIKVQPGDGGSAVSAVQSQLKAPGTAISVDGSFRRWHRKCGEGIPVLGFPATHRHR